MEIGQADYGSGGPFLYVGTVRDYGGYSEFTYGNAPLGATYSVLYSSPINNGEFRAYVNGQNKSILGGFGYGGCRAAAGTVIVTNPGAGVSFGNIVANTSAVTNFIGTRSDSTTFNSWSDAVIDRPCTYYFSPCMNGAFYLGNQRWESNRG